MIFCRKSTSKTLPENEQDDFRREILEPDEYGLGAVCESNDENCECEICAEGEWSLGPSFSTEAILFVDRYARIGEGLLYVSYQSEENDGAFEPETTAYWFVDGQVFAANKGGKKELPHIPFVESNHNIDRIEEIVNKTEKAFLKVAS